MSRCQIIIILLAAMVHLVRSESLVATFRKESQVGTHSYDAVYNIGPRFRGRSKRVDSPRTSQFVELIEGFDGRRSNFAGCRQTGVLKVTLSNSTVSTERSRVFIDMIVSRPRSYVFNVGDSRGNNAGGGDDGTQSNDAEIVGFNDDLRIYLDDANSGRLAHEVENLYTDRVTLLIGDGGVVWSGDSEDAYNYYHDSGLFALDDQFDSEGSENFDIYIGINRAIREGTTNTGSGVCSIGIKFLPVYS